MIHLSKLLLLEKEKEKNLSKLLLKIYKPIENFEKHGQIGKCEDT